MKHASRRCHEILATCKTKLGIEFRKGKELSGWFSINGQKAVRITVPKGRKPAKLGTYRSMARQLQLTSSEFDDLLDCPLKREPYIRLLRQRKKL